MSLASSSLSDKIKMRSLALAKVRHFFHERQVLEVDTPSMIPYANLDQHIDPMQVENEFLRTSPEYALKQMLAKGAPDIYEIGHVFRKGERGKKHNPEFTMIEWYRLGFSLQQMIQETLELIDLFCKDLHVTFWTYQTLFQTFLQIDPLHCSLEKLETKLPTNSPNLNDKDEVLQFLLTEIIEPKIQDQIHVISDFPKTQCALARIEKGVAKRFEIYVHGLEVANGYNELCSSEEQKTRFIRENELRKRQNKAPFDLDDAFISCLDSLPQCSGVAVGFDRLLMLQNKIENIDDAIF